MDQRIIKVTTCGECPYVRKDDGGGYASSFVICDKFDIMLFDWDGPEDFAYAWAIHPDCRLEKA
jgi:hypothetical protein